MLKLAEKLGGKTNSIAAGKAQYFSYRYQLEEARKEAEIVLQSDPNRSICWLLLELLSLKTESTKKLLTFRAGISDRTKLCKIIRFYGNCAPPR